MRAPQRIEKIQEIASLLVPMQGYQLLLPNVSVAEIVPVAPVTPESDSPAWWLGRCRWRDLAVPLISIEALNGYSKSAMHPRTRFAVLNTTGVSEHLPFLAIVTQGLPRLARVTEEEIVALEQETKSFELMQVSWAGEEAVIPDIERIEREILGYLGR